MEMIKIYAPYKNIDIFPVFHNQETAVSSKQLMWSVCDSYP